TLSRSLSETTLTTYAAGPLCFTQFCNRWSIDKDNRMPASPILLSAFLGSHAGTVSSPTAKNWVAGMRMWHIINNAEWHSDHEWVRLALRTACKEGSRFKCPLRSPVTIRHLRVLKEHLRTNEPYGAAVFVVAIVTFFGCHRLGETTVPSNTGFDSKLHATRASEITFSTTADGIETVDICIPWTKTTKEAGGTIILTAHGDDICPVEALKNHLKINNLPKEASLFAYRKNPVSNKDLNNTIPWVHMHKQDFLKMVNHFWTFHSLGAINGHSFRIGGTVALLLAGVPPKMVAATGGWTSLAFLGYWRRIEDIVTAATSQAYRQKTITEIGVAFEKFRIQQNLPVSSL
ncbi:hypothetical protein FA15DRAFT_592269, partial [Coprinopsis marcescibilis]